MNDGVPRLRMFAGPIGSGKTTAKERPGKFPEWFGLYINPDDLEREIRQYDSLPADSFGFPSRQKNFDIIFAPHVCWK